MANTIILYKGKEILYTDYRGCKTDTELIAVLDEAAQILESRKDKVLGLSNYEGIFAGQDFMNRIKQVGREVASKKFDRSAAIGVTGLKQILFQAYIAFTGDKNTRAFSSEEEAKDWLAS